MTERTYFHYEDLEEVPAGLWKIVRGEERKKNIIDAAELMKDSGSFREMMELAIRQWPNSAQYNLTAENTNRIAWLGHAGCCVGVGSPEENTRCAWHTLTRTEQDEANATAALVLMKWDDAQLGVKFPLFKALNDA